MVRNHLKYRWLTVLYDEMVLFDRLLTSDRSNFGQIILNAMILELFTHYKCHKPLESNLTWPKNEPNLYFSKSVYPFLHWIIPSQPKGKIHALGKISKTTEGVRGKHFGFKSFSNRLVHMNWVEIFWAIFYMLKSLKSGLSILITINNTHNKKLSFVAKTLCSTKENKDSTSS